MAANGTPQSQVESRFKAFVSYSHADKAAAQKLHRKLETYRLPKHLRSSEPSTHAAEGRIGAIFRDREDLPAAQDLSESVKEALSASEALVVLCSPDAQKSPWVAREIELFRDIHPDRPVLAAILRGEPEEAFPEPLKQGREPLAADLRKEGDGPRLGFLKVVAGIAEVPLDALVNRDAQRRVRRVTAVTVAAIAAMVVMALMTTFALQARDEARSQRESAEDVIEFMMTDLRTDLRGVGRLDVMESVNGRAIEFYESQGDISDLPVDSALRWARILHAMGEDEIVRADGTHEEALVQFSKARSTTRAVLEAAPDDPQRIYTHAQSEYWIGRVHELNREWKQARSHYNSYSEAGLRLVNLDKQNSDFAMEAGWGHLNLGIVDLKERIGPDFGGARFEKAIKFMSYAQGLQPDNLTIAKEWGNAWAWLADSYLLKRDYSLSLDARKKELEAKERWRKANPRDLDARYAVAKAKFAIAFLEVRYANGRKPHEQLNEASAEIDGLVTAEPKNVVWRAMQARIDEFKTK